MYNIKLGKCVKTLTVAVLTSLISKVNKLPSAALGFIFRVKKKT